MNRTKGRIALWSTAVLTGVAAIGLLGITAALNSEAVSRKVLQFAAASAGIEVLKISGTLAAGIRLEELRYTGNAAVVSIDNLDFDWEPLALLYASGMFRAVRFEGVHIRYTPAPGKSATPQTEPPDISLPLRLSLGADIHGLQLDYGEHRMTWDYIRLDGTLGSRLALNELIVETPVYRLAVSGVVGSRFPYAGELALQWQYHAVPDTGFVGMADIRGDIAQFELEHRLTEPGDLVTTGRVNSGLAGATPHVELHNRWNLLQLQAPFLPFTINSSGELDVSGWLDDYRLQGKGQVEPATKLPPFRFSLNAGGNRQGLDKLALNLDALEGKITAEGSLQWLPAVQWRGDIATDGVDLRSFHAELPRNLQLQFHTEGERMAGEWHGRLRDIRGIGSIRDYSMQLDGELTLDRDSFSSRSLRFAIAENSLTLSGSIGRRLDLQWQCRAPQLAALWPGLSGTLSADGRITGTRGSPDLKAAVTAEKLAYAGYRISRLYADLKTEKPGQHALTLTAGQISRQDNTVSAFTLNVRGNSASHVIESRIQDDSLTAVILAAGSYVNSRWQAQLRRADWDPQQLPAWSLQTPVDLTAGSGVIRMDSACWSAADARVCAQFSRGDKGDMDGKADLSSVPAGLLDPWLNPRLTFNGLIDGSLALNGRNGDLTGSLQLEAHTGEIGVRREGMPMDSYHWENAFLRAELRNKLLTSQAGLTFPGYGNAGSTLDINLGSRALNGDIFARFDNLAPLQTVIPDFDGLIGHLQAAVKLAGTLDSPLLSGSLRLRDGSARIPRLGIQIRDLQFKAEGANSKDIIFDGSAESGSGRLELDGTLVYDAVPELRASIAGRNFEILRLPDIQATINPELDIKAWPKRIDLQGTILIPTAQMNIRTPPESAVAVSEDVVIVDESPKVRGETIRFTSRVRLILGDDILFQGYGFNAGLDGQLTLRKTSERPVATAGELTVKQGQYKAFGQQLDIERGRLLFQGPYDNPGLDILAARRTPDVTVRLEIGGKLDSPRSRVFSDPPLPESEAMAILLTGKPLRSASKSDANALVNAIAALGLRKGKFITDDIARTFKLDEFNIKSEPGSDVTTSSLFIGKQISPRLFIRYIVGLFDQTSRIGLSYQLSRQLRLEAESGWNQSMDLIYEIER